MKRANHPFGIILKLVSTLFIVLFSFSSLLLFFAKLISGRQCVFSTFPGSSNFHCMFPYQYLTVFCIAVSLCISIWIVYWSQKRLKEKYISLAVALIGIIVLSSFFGGILWGIHTLLIEHSWRDLNVFQFFFLHISRTFRYGWIAIVRSFPYNLVALLVVIPATAGIARIFNNWEYVKK